MSAPRGGAAFGIAATALVVALGGGCTKERTLTESDCALIKHRIDGAWNRDAVAAMRAAKTDRYRRYVLDEGRRLGDAWMADCKDMVGRPVPQAELDCLAKAETIDDIYACKR